MSAVHRGKTSWSVHRRILLVRFIYEYVKFLADMYATSKWINQALRHPQLRSLISSATVLCFWDCITQI